MDVEYLQLAPGEQLRAPIQEPLLAVRICESDCSLHWRNAVCSWLIDSGCLCVVAWGLDCEDWHDRADRENRERFGCDEIPDDNFVMTTWHADEPLHEAMWFACHCSFHPSVELQRTVLIHVAERADEARILGAYNLALRDDCSDEPES